MGNSSRDSNADSEICALEKTIQEQHTEIARLKFIIDNLPGDIYWKNTAGVWLGVNLTGVESLRQMGFVQTRNDAIGKTDHELFSKQTADEFRKNDLEVMEKGIEITNEETNTLPNGEERFQLSTKRPLRDENNQIIGIIGNTINISHLKKIEADLRAAKEKAEQASIIKMDFIRNMEHDIRTPFTGAWGIAKYLFEKETDPEKKDLLGGIACCTKELLDFCNTILDFSRLETTSLPVLNNKFSIRELAKKLRDAELLAAKYKQLQLIIHCDDNLPEMLLGDDYRLYRVLLNLISNAIKFTHAGYVKITIKLAKQEANTVFLKFIIEDTGIGIPKEKQSFIYETFSRINPSNQGKYVGLGLGLRIVKRFIQEMGGEIDLVSEIGQGSTFTCVLPFQLP